MVKDTAHIYLHSMGEVTCDNSIEYENKAQKPEDRLLDKQQTNIMVPL